MDELAAQRDAELETDLIAQHHTAINQALAIAKKGSSSTVKVALLKALSLMKGHEIRVDEDAPSSALNPIISDMLPPADHDYWGDKAKPRSQVVNMRRMSKAGLLEPLWGSGDQMIGFRLTAAGMAYLVTTRRDWQTSSRWSAATVPTRPRTAGFGWPPRCPPCPARTTTGGTSPTPAPTCPL